MSKQDICRWDEQKQQYEIDNKRTLTQLWLKEVDSFKWNPVSFCEPLEEGCLASGLLELKAEGIQIALMCVN